MTIGQKIKGRRKELGLTVEEVAARLGKNRATVYRYESDYIENLPITVLEPLAEILKTTPAALMGWEAPPARRKGTPIKKSLSPAPLQTEPEGPNPPEDVARTPQERRILLLARHLERIPEEKRERIIRTFEDSIDLYLDAMGIKEEDNEV